MRILITSGGTKVPIDAVRSITNTSTGKFGASIATAALENHCEVVYFASAHAFSPFSCEIDVLHHANEHFISKRIKDTFAFKNKYYEKYKEYRFLTFDDYLKQLESLLHHYQPDVVILAAAVSDYLIKNHEKNKIQSSKIPVLDLMPAPKVIQHIKTWLPKTFLVGFKLLVNASEEELIQHAMLTLQNSNADLVIANDLSTIRKAKHEILIVEPSGHYEKYKKNLAEVIIKKILGMCS